MNNDTNVKTLGHRARTVTLTVQSSWEVDLSRESRVWRTDLSK